MSVFILDDSPHFPEINQANDNGLLAIGGDLNPDRLINAYENGIFPWYSEGQPVLWWSPDPRFILKTDRVHISRSLKSFMRKSAWTFKINTAFEQVIHYCKKVERPGQDGTWITSEMKNAYIKLHKLGKADSFEVWENDELIGGMYGVRCENYFAGESMFSLKSNASKMALVKACFYLFEEGIELLDCQIHSDHLERMGAEYISRDEFKKYLNH